MPDFEDIRHRCDGMLRADVYQALHETASHHADGQFVEVGTGHAAGTVCLALAMRVGHSFDRFTGGSRARYQGDNEAIARANLRHFGVAGRVTIHAGDVGERIGDLGFGPVDLLFLDCDGRIDRDFLAMGSRLRPGASIIIDDCADRVRVRAREAGAARVDMKHRVTWLLTQSLVDEGFLVFDRMVNQTWFGTWAGKPISEWSPQSIIAAYRQLVFSDGEMIR